MDPEDRAKEKIDLAPYEPIDEDAALKRAMIAEIVDALNTAAADKVAMILDQIKIDYAEGETWHDEDGPNAPQQEESP